MIPTPEQIENRRKLISYLKKKTLKAKFDMGAFTELANSFEDQDLLSDCGTIGCAVGHGPYAGINKEVNEDWLLYSYRAFGIDFEFIEWDFCFSGEWENHDNTALGAAKRLEFFTDKNPYEEEMIAMMPWMQD